MKKLLLFIAAFLFAVGSYSNQNIKQMLLNENAFVGTEFLVSVPPNDNPSQPLQSVSIYIAATEETEVRLSNTSGTISEGTVPANDVALFSTTKVMYELPETFENWTNEQVLDNRAIIIESEKPVSVYVMNSKMVSTEGYLAIPVKSWGEKYIHNSYWDFKEVRSWGGGFQVIASEDDTRVSIELKGKGEGLGQTTGGKVLGDRLRPTLDKGQIYQVQGDGNTRGVFDLSGTVITSNKPIAIVSYHNRTMIPKFVVTNGRDHLSSMPLHVDSWGTDYYSVEINRGTGAGDYFRVVSSESNNEVTFTWYDSATGLETNKVVSVLGESEVWTPFELDADNNTRNGVSGVNGTMSIKSQKPIMVMQYSYSANWDNAGGGYDPFMFTLIPEQSWSYASIFQTPKNYNPQNEFNDNYVTVLFKGDTTDAAEHIRLTESIIFDGAPITTFDVNSANQRIPGTDIFFARLKGVEQGVHKMTGDTKFTSYIYGFANFDSYGWPGAGTTMPAKDPTVAVKDVKIDVASIRRSDDKISVMVYSNAANYDLEIATDIDDSSISIKETMEGFSDFGISQVGSAKIFDIENLDKDSANEFDFTAYLDNAARIVNKTYNFIPEASDKELILTSNVIDFGNVDAIDSGMESINIKTLSDPYASLTSITIPSFITYEVKNAEGFKEMPVTGDTNYDIEFTFSPDKNLLNTNNSSINGKISIVSDAGTQQIDYAGNYAFSKFAFEDSETVLPSGSVCQEKGEFSITNNGSGAGLVKDVLIGKENGEMISFSNKSEFESEYPGFEITQSASASINQRIESGSTLSFFGICYKDNSKYSDSLIVEPVFDSKTDINDTGEQITMNFIWSMSVQDELAGTFDIIRRTDNGYTVSTILPNVSYSIVDINGKTMATGTFQQGESSFTMPNRIGTYFLVLDINGESKAIKLQ
ncbi:MAG: hypothetical protein Kapaf2KO_13510 [Candidatus Kapaibacteriales bacterium]